MGHIGKDWRDSEPWWPEVLRPPDGAPNVVMVVLDDVGYAQLGCYGSDILTPVIDSIAASGVRLANFRTTALCSPTRACLLTGRNHHRNGMGRVADLAMGYPGYWGKPPRENGFLSEVLSANGYANYAIGKWHLTPEDETHMGATRESWPLGRGFDRWYGFHGGETHQFNPALYHDNHCIQAPFDKDYHLSADLADRAITHIGDLRAVDGTKPFFLYFATGACHSPHQAPRDWIDRYKGHFDCGWDVWREKTYQRQLELGVIPEGTELSPRPPWVQAWDELDNRRKEVCSRFMECFAGYLSYTDRQLGRLRDFLSDISELDNTIFMIISDNGASAEGGPEGSLNDQRMANFDPSPFDEIYEHRDQIGGPLTHNNYPWGWTMAGNTPFKRWKREVHHGGVADPCVISWPKMFAGNGSDLGGLPGSVRHQFAHAIDVMPTLLELIGIDVPETIGYVPQSRIDGISFAYVLKDDGTQEPGRHVTQHFEMFASRAIYHDGWKAVTFRPVGPLYGDGLDPNAPIEDDKWELYHVATDLSECHDLADELPLKLVELEALWWREAERNDVLPLDNRVLWTLAHPRPDHRAPRDSIRYFQNGAQVPEPMAQNVRNRAHVLRVECHANNGVVPSGVLLAQGSALGGWSLHLIEGKPRYLHNLYGKELHVIEATEEMGSGTHVIEYRYTPIEKGERLSGTGALYLDSKLVGEGSIPRFTPSGFNGVGAGLTCGYEWGPALSGDYEAPFVTNVEIKKAEVEVTGPVVRDLLGELSAIMAEQ